MSWVLHRVGELKEKSGEWSYGRNRVRVSFDNKKQSILILLTE